VGSSAERIHSKLLVLRYQRGDAGAFGELIQLWERPLFFYLRRLLQQEEDAWDALQEVWIAAIRSLGSLRDLDSLRAWLYRIARNAALMQLRKRKDEAPFAGTEDGEIIEPPAPEPDVSLLDAEALYWGLKQLSPKHSEVLTLSFLEGFTTREIAGILDVSEGAVKSRLHYAKLALREILAKEGVLK
jgi:RNA polymerase sigma-70 factor, ECF subfamily